jgi:hypothetical protein
VIRPRPGGPFAVAPDGLSFAAGDGPELLTWRSDGAAQWKVFTDGLLVGVAITPTEVVTVDDRCHVARFRRTDGELLSRTPIEGQPTDLGQTVDGRLFAVTPAGPMVDTPIGWRLLPAAGCTAAALGPGEAVGVGTESGRFSAIEARSGAPWGTVELGAPVAAVAWSALGCWLVAAGRSLVRVSGDGKVVQATIPGADHEIESLTVTHNGVIVAARAGDRVELWELHRNRPIGEFLLRRPLGDVAFGPGLLLAIGLDDGDGNWIELATGATFRTEPHPGRNRTTWRLENKVDLGAVRGAIALQQAGGAPIARYVPRPDPEGGGGGGGGMLAGCISVLGATFTATLICTGVLGLMYVLKTYDLWRYLPLR